MVSEKIESVTISKKDIEFLKRIPVDSDRRILFSILILAKSFKKF